MDVIQTNLEIFLRVNGSFFEKKSAENTIKIGLINSEGWIRKLPKFIQRVAPRVISPTKYGRIIKAIPIIKSGVAKL